jgi:hypothetical protein
MKISVSIPEEDVEFLDAYIRDHNAGSRSAALHEAVGLLRAAQLAGDVPDLEKEIVKNDVLVIGIWPDIDFWCVVDVEHFPRNDGCIISAFLLRYCKVYSVALDCRDAFREFVVIMDVLRLNDRFVVRNDIEEHFPLPWNRAHVALFILERLLRGIHRGPCANALIVDERKF